MPAVAETSASRRGEAGRAGSDVRSDLHVTLRERASGGIEIDLRSRVELVLRRGDPAAGARCVARCLASSTRTSISWMKVRCRSSSRRASKRRCAAPDSGHGESALPEAIALPAPSPRDRLRRSRLYLPGNEPKYFVNAGLHAPDAIILDLEDSVHFAEKDAARLLVRNALRAVDFGAAERMVRINQLPLGLADLEEIVPQSPDLILIPKVETPRAGI